MDEQSPFSISSSDPNHRGVAAGTVINKYIVADEQGTLFYLTYTFSHAGIVYTRAERVDETLYKRMETGTTLDVAYIPIFLTDSRIIGNPLRQDE